jgi:TctA family transporter
VIQFYFLSILFNALAGFILFTENSEGESSLEERIKLPVNNEIFRLVLGILALVTGLLKLLSSIQGDLPVIGDLVPAFTGFFTGFILVFSYYDEHASTDEGKFRNFGAAVLRNKKWMGLAAMAAAVLHFLFPQVLLL